MSLKHLLIGLVKTLQMPLNDGLSSLTMIRFKQQLDVHQRGAEFIVLIMVNLARSTSVELWCNRLTVHTHSQNFNIFTASGLRKRKLRASFAMLSPARRSRPVHLYDIRYNQMKSDYVDGPG